MQEIWRGCIAYEVTNFVQELVRAGRDIEDRAALIIKAIDRAKGLHLPLLIVSGETKYRYKKTPDALLIPERRLPKIQSALARRISALADRSLLSRSHFLRWKLNMWEAAAGNERQQTIGQPAGQRDTQRAVRDVLP